ncbi:hypothetical protein AB4Z22_30440, partial [Paenibacillus sp. TAF58]
MKNSDLIDELVKFSNEKHINISQYNFMSEQDLNMYSTNVKDDPKIILKSGLFPKDKLYISNKNALPDQIEQSGDFVFPLSSWNIHIYEFKQLRNVGLKDEFHFSGADINTIKVFIEEFSIYGSISLKNEKISSLVSINMSLLMIAVFSFFILSIGILYFLIQNRKMIILKVLWGYSKWRVLFSVPRLILFFLIVICAVLLIALFISINAFDQSQYTREYFLMYIVVNVIVTFIVLLVALSGTWFIEKYNNNFEGIKGRLPFKKLQWISTILKLVVYIILFSVVSSSVSNLYNLQNDIKKVDFWNKTKNIFRIQVGPLSDASIKNLKLNRELNNKLFKFYKKIEEENEAFLMVSQNFQIVSQNNGVPVYLYNLNTTKEDELYAAKGRSVVINKNYLKINPIYGINERNISDEILINPDTLNILVPEKFKYLESKIIKSYKEWFYFYKVRV